MQNQDTVDALIEVVSQQIELLSFDPNDSDLLERLVDSFADSREVIRLKVLELFGEIGEDATPILTTALLHHPNVEVRRLCAQAIARLGDDTAIPTLVEVLLNEPNDLIKSSVIGALARMGESAVAPLLRVIASPQSPEPQKGQATWALSCLGPDAIDSLYAAAQTENASIRGAAIGAIAALTKQYPSSRLTTLLLNALRDPIADVRLEAASGLGKLTNHNATPNLIPLLNDPDPDVRRTVALSLGTLKDKSARAPLEAQKNDASESVRTVVLWALRQLQGSPSYDVANRP